MTDPARDDPYPIYAVLREAQPCAAEGRGMGVTLHRS